MLIRLCKCCQESEINIDNTTGLCSMCRATLENEGRPDFYKNEEDIYIEQED